MFTNSTNNQQFVYLIVSRFPFRHKRRRNLIFVFYFFRSVLCQMLILWKVFLAPTYTSPWLMLPIIIIHQTFRVFHPYLRLRGPCRILRYTFHRQLELIPLYSLLILHRLKVQHNWIIRLGLIKIPFSS